MTHQYLRAYFRKHSWTIIVCFGLCATLAIGAVWLIGRRPTLEIKPENKVLLVLYGLSLQGRSPTSDETELLASQADVAVPFLIERMIAGETTNAGYEDWSWSMDALGTIGAPAVPALIETMEHARERVAAAESDSSDVAKEMRECAIQIRAAMVLGRIADARALPALLKLQAESDHCLPYEFDFAIRRVNNTERLRRK